MTKYCTYITVYRGTLLPPFYIGYTSVDKIHKGYKGSVSSKLYKEIWLNEIKTHPELFYTKIISTYNDINEAKYREEILQKALNVVNNPLYINMNISGRNFKSQKLSKETKLKISLKHKNKAVSESVKIKISNTLKGRNISEAHRQKISLSLKGILKSETHKKNMRVPKKNKFKSRPPHTKDTRNIICLKKSKPYTIFKDDINFNVVSLSLWCRETFENPISAAIALRSKITYKGYTAFKITNIV